MSNFDFEKVVRKNDCAVVIVRDCAPESPREWDNLGRMYLKTRSVYQVECSENEFNFALVKVPVYKYEHSGISLSTSNASYPFNDVWDSCLAGYIIATAEDIRKAYNVKRITKKLLEKVEEVLKGEVETYNAYINGEVYGYQVYEGVTDNIPDEEIKDECDMIDSCYGFYDMEEAVNEGLEIVPASKELAMA